MGVSGLGFGFGFGGAGFLDELTGRDRTARFRTVVALVTPAGDESVAEGVLAGTITRTPRGSDGFGYVTHGNFTVCQPIQGLRPSPIAKGPPDLGGP